VRVLVLALQVYGGEGGIQRFTRRMVDSLDDLTAQGIIESAATIALWDTSADRQQQDAVYVPCRHSKLRLIAAVDRLGRQQSFDVVVYTHVLLAPLSGWLSLRLPSARHVVIAHGVEVWGKPPPWRRIAVRRWVDRVAAVSRYSSEEMRIGYDLPPERLTILANAVDDPPVARLEAPVAVRPVRLLTVCRLTTAARDKHVDQVLRALPAIIERHPGVEYVVVGGGDWLPELRRLAVALGVQDAVRFEEWVSDEVRDDLYANSDVFVLPSTREGFGIVYLEAWRHGLAVIGGSDGAAPELLADGGAGLSVSPDPSDIADAVNQLLADPARCRRMGEEGRRRVREHYSGLRFTENLEALLTSVGPGPRDETSVR
jgi:phosphatidylinositol alpha-1,6-mannosyltransferase